ncbi:MAG TPA: hypothetical protein VGM90_13985 [Kofleriaceae bacterium]|jgi:hypothetical protein
MKRIGIPIALLLAACVAQVRPAPTPEVQGGPAEGARPGRILVLEPSCGGLEEKCPQTYVRTVDNMVRASLEFKGLAVVDPDHLRLETRQRHETREVADATSHEDTATNSGFDHSVRSTKDTSSSSEKTTIVLDGPGFDDLTPAERDAALDQAGADSIVVTRVVVGAQQGWNPNVPNQTVEVMVRLAVNRGDTMVWASRCSASSSEYSTITAALEQATRCAVYGGTGN